MMKGIMGKLLSLLLALLMLAGSLSLAAFATGNGLGANYTEEDDMTPDNLGILKESSGIKISNLQQLKFAEDWTQPVTGKHYSAGDVLPVGSATNAIHGGHHTRVLRTENGTYAVIITRTVDRDNKMVEPLEFADGYNEYNDPDHEHVISWTPIDLNEKYKDDPDGHPYWINGMNYYSIVKLTPNGVQVLHTDVCPENDSSHVPEIYAGEGDHIYVIFPGEDPDTYYTKWRAQYEGEIPKSEFKNAGYLILHEIDTATDTLVRTKKAVISFDTCAFDDHGYGKPSALVDIEARKIYCIYDGGYGGNEFPAYFAWFIYDMDTNEWEPTCHTLTIGHRNDYYNLYPDGKGGATFIIQRCIVTKYSQDILGYQLFPTDSFAWDSVYYYHIKDMEAVTFSNDKDLDRGLYDYVEYPISAADYTPFLNNSRINVNAASHYGNSGCTYQDDQGRIHVIYTETMGNKVDGKKVPPTTYHSIIDTETDTEIYKEMIPGSLLKSSDGKENGKTGYGPGMGFTMTQGADGTYYIFHFTKANPATVEVFSSPAGDGINFTRKCSATALTDTNGGTVIGGYPIIGNSRDGSVLDGVIPMIFNSSTNPANGSSNSYYYFSVDVGKIPAHAHEYTDTVVAPTCTKQGYTEHVCSICGKVIKDTYTDPAGHNWGDWGVTTEPTCTDAGVETRTCSKCGETETRPVGALGHAWDDGTVTLEPTATEEGVKTFVCGRCRATKTETIPATGPTHIPGDINGDGAVNSKDLTRLLKYLSGDSVPVNEAALDVNGDGAVNSKDLTRLLKYLSGDNVAIY